MDKLLYCSLTILNKSYILIQKVELDKYYFIIFDFSFNYYYCKQYLHIYYMIIHTLLVIYINISFHSSNLMSQYNIPK